MDLKSSRAIFEVLKVIVPSDDVILIDISFGVTTAIIKVWLCFVLIH